MHGRWSIQPRQFPSGVRFHEKDWPLVRVESRSSPCVMSESETWGASWSNLGGEVTIYGLSCGFTLSMTLLKSGRFAVMSASGPVKRQ